MNFNSYHNEHNQFYSGGYPLGMYMSNTFLWMFLGLLITFGTVIFCWLSGISFLMLSGLGMILVTAMQLILVLVLSALIERLTVGAARFCFIGYSVLTGIRCLSIFICLS